jgi:hypothetical protein
VAAIMAIAEATKEQQGSSFYEHYTPEMIFDA